MHGFLVVLLLGSAPAPSRPPSTELADAIRLYQELKFERAAAKLENLLRGSVKTVEAARAHLYLGLIAAEKIDIDRARSEFRQALLLNPTTELPPLSSAKIQVVFDQVRRDIERQEGQPRWGPPERVPEPALARTAETAPVRPIPTSFWVTFGVGGALALGGLAVGLQSQSSLSAAGRAPDIGSTLRLQGQATTERAVADACFGGALVAGVIATVLFFTRGPAPAAPATGAAL